MKLPTYVTVDEVKRVCSELGLRDWTKLKKADVTLEEAKTILRAINTGGMVIRPEDFRLGLEVELEHGTRFPEANVTNNHPILTGQIVIAHFMETLDYYQRLDVAEIEGDLLKALVAKRSDKIQKLYAKLVEAKKVLGERELEQAR